jgi:hypothetical protein
MVRLRSSGSGYYRTVVPPAMALCECGRRAFFWAHSCRWGGVDATSVPDDLHERGVERKWLGPSVDAFVGDNRQAAHGAIGGRGPVTIVLRRTPGPRVGRPCSWWWPMTCACIIHAIAQPCLVFFLRDPSLV